MTPGTPTGAGARHVKLRAGLLTVKEKLGSVRASADSDDGLVTATVNGRGELVELTLNPRTFRSQDSRALAKSIKDTVDRATEGAARQAAELAERSLR